MANDNPTRPSLRARLPRARFIVLGLVVLFGLIQLVPYGHTYSNPPVTVKPKWPSASVERLANDACADCHSNTTTWPAYARIAPGSWLIRKDVVDGRRSLNWSEPCGESGDVAEVTRSGEMPPIQYKILHPGARLSKAEQRELADGLAQALRDIPGSLHECRGG